MIIGSTQVPQVVEESVCRSSEDYYFTEIADYKIHSTSLMTYIEFGEALVTPESQNDSIFINDDETKPIIPALIDCQNFLTTHYAGRAPLEHYGDPTELGREFILLCKNGDPAYIKRAFGTQAAIDGYSKDAYDNVKLPNE